MTFEEIMEELTRDANADIEIEVFDKKETDEKAEREFEEFIAWESFK